LARKNIIDLALESSRLLEQAAIHNMAYFRNLSANYPSAKIGSLRLLPNDRHIEALAHDFQLMNSMFLSPPPAFNELMDELKEIEQRINNANNSD